MPARQPLTNHAARADPLVGRPAYRFRKARLYVHGNEQPTLVVNDVKSGAHGKGAVALWLEPGTVAHFRNLTVDVAPDER